jgi:hypothetical protein
MSSTRPYSAFLTAWANLVGIPPDAILESEATVANTGFDSAMEEIWIAGPWLDTCPRGEARFYGNSLTYGNDPSVTTAWTNTALTITKNSVVNPADGRTTGAKLIETAATSTHKIVQSSINFFPSTDYTVTAYVRANQRSWVQLSVSDGATTHSCFYDVSTGVVGTASNTTTTAIAQQPNGFWLCQFTFTSATTATAAGTYSLLISTDGSTTSYAGDTSKGLYCWGLLMQQSSVVGQDSALIRFDQTGEAVIDTVFDVYKNNPFGVANPVPQAYTLTTAGIQLINGTFSSYYVNGVNQSNIYGISPANPVWVYYRKAVPDFSGSVYDAADTYAVNEQIYFTSADGTSDFWKCLVATTAGQSPTTTPTSWEIIPLYQPFFNFCLYKAYGDWLIADGQMEKATGAYAIAQRRMDAEFDKRERQEGDVMPCKFQTHLTSRSSW